MARLPARRRPRAGPAMTRYRPGRAVADVVIVGAGVVGTAIARELARYAARRCVLLDAAADVGTGHVQGEHGDPAHRLRRHAGHAREPPGARGAARCCAPTPQQAGIAVERDRRAAGRLERRAAGGAARHRGEARGATGTRPPAAAGPTSSTRASRTSGRARPARWRCPTSASSARGRRRSPSRPRRSRAGVELRARRPRSPGVDAGRTAGTSWRTARGPLRCRWVVNAAGLRQRRGRPDVRPRRLHHHAAARRADRLRQAGPAAAVARSCCRCRPRGPRACWSRPRCSATCCSGRPREDVTDRADTRHDRGRAAGRCSPPGGGSCPGCPARRSPRPTPGCAPRPSTPTTRSAPTPSSATCASAASARPG